MFDFVYQGNLTAENLKPYRALLIPDAAYLRDSECEVIQQYAASGGSVLATFETSRYNEWGEPRADFSLADLFGVSLAVDVIGPSENSYMYIRRGHPILEGFTGTQILPGTEYRVAVSPLGPESLDLSVIPDYSPHPPEMDYARILKTSEPAAVFRQRGTSRVVHFPGDVERAARRSGNVDLGLLLRNSIAWLLAESSAPASVEGAGMMELFAWETEPGFALHILNYTNPNMTRPFIREYYPIGPLNVEIDGPAGKKISTVRALRAGRNLTFQREGSGVRLEVPLVQDYEVIALT